MRTLTESERTTITNSLRVAAERFDEHVRMFRHEPLSTLGITRNAADSLACTFENQARESRTLAGLIDDCKTLSLEPGQTGAEHDEILSAVIAELTKRGVDGIPSFGGASLEYPSMISIALPDGGALVCGTVNGNFGIDHCAASDQNCIASFESEIPYDSSDVRAIADFIAGIYRQRSN